MKTKKLFFIGVFIAVLTAALDLWTKDLVFTILDNKASEAGLEFAEISVLSFFSLIKVWNYGISFGMFNQLENSQIIFCLIQGMISLVLLIWLFYNQNSHFTYALGLIIGGAWGNLTDRFMNGAVADFLDFHIASYHWPAFNLADSCVFIGVMILLFDEYVCPIHKLSKKKKSK